MTRVWVNGRMFDGDTATIGALGAGVLTGSGVFESMKVLRGAVFARSRHLARLRRSAELVGLVVPDDHELGRAFEQVLAAAPEVTVVRVTILAGRALTETPTVIVHGEARPLWPPTARALTSEWVRNERGALAGAKITSNAASVVARRVALSQGADEALLFDTQGHLSEGTASNIFIEVDGRLCTPAPENGCLAGVTRDLVCELVEVDVRADLDAEHLATTREAFLTSSSRDVHPLAWVDRRELPEAPGPLTRAAAAALTELQRHTADP